MTHIVNNIGSQLHPATGLAALTNSAGTRNGSAVDRLQGGSMANSLVLLCNVGATTGSPSAQTYDCKLQDSADGSTGWNDIAGAAITQKTSATAALSHVDVNLAGAKRYLRVVEVVAFTGGSQPATPAGVVLVLGGFDRIPA